MHTFVDRMDGDNSHVVVPNSKYEHVCEFDHDRARHLGACKACQMIKMCFM